MPSNRVPVLFAAVVLSTSGCSHDSAEKVKEQAVFHLPSGDSIEVVGIGPAVVPDRTAGLLFTFYPFVPIADTVRIRRVAAELWRVRVKSQLPAPPPSFVVLQATSRRAGPINGIARFENYGIVLERRADGNWYYLKGGARAE